jgi:NADH:ubiquinone oxidoreductase subunit E
LEILHETQNGNPQQYISPENIATIAKHLNITQSQVYGVVGYYSMLSIKPRGKYLIRVCNSPICNMLGSEHTIDYLIRKLNVQSGETTADGKFTIEECECLGNCAAAPSIMVNDKLYGNLTPELIDKILGSL